MDRSALLQKYLASAKRPLIAVVGPTASGKTAFSINLAKEIAAQSSAHGWQGAEVVNADARQLYKGMDIGTAKITKEEADGVPHRLIDVLDPKDKLTVGMYKQMAEKEIDAILERKHVPLLVGGSMLYVSSVVDGLIPLPAADADLRARLEAEYDVDEGKTLHRRLSRQDPVTAETIHRNNRPSTIRAVEILELTGQAPSAIKTKTEVPYNVLLFGMRWPREKLVHRIDARTKILFAAGWITEVRKLLASGYTLEDPGMKSHGYREIAAAIIAHPDWDDAQIGEDKDLVDTINKNTRQYAKRQMTWWKPDSRIHWIDPV